MKLNQYSLKPWISQSVWLLGPARWWLLALSLAAVGCMSIATYWLYEADELDAQATVALQKIKSKRNEQRQGLVNRTVVSNEKEAQIELRLPLIQSAKAAPLGKFLSESKLKGVVLKQVDYVWPKLSSKSAKADSSVGKIEVNLSVEGNYTAVRAWLGELLIEETNIQISAIQFQRLARDSALINGIITLSVFYQELM